MKYKCIWYFFLLSILICVGCSYIINRYSKDVFSVSSTVLIEDNLKGVVEDPSQMLFNNEIFVPAQNMNNQMILLKSYNLTKKTVQDLNIINSSLFYLQPDDVVYVEPLQKKFFGFKDIASTLSFAISSYTLYYLISQ